MSKRLIILLSILIALIGFPGWFFFKKEIVTQLSAEAAFPTIPSMITRPFTYMSMSTISSSEVDTNENTNTMGVNDILTYLTDLQTNNLVDKVGNNTLSGNNTYSGTSTFSGGVTITGTFNDTNLVLDNDNAGAEAASQCYAINRGSTSTSDPGICWTTGGLAKIVSDKTTLALDKLQVADGASGNDVVTYQQVPKLATTNTFTQINTFNELPTLDAYEAPTMDAQLAPKKYVDDQTGSLSVGGIIQQGTEPSTANNTLWIDNSSSSNYKFFRANGTRFDPVTGIHQGTTAPTTPAPAAGHLWIDTTDASNPVLKRYDGTTWDEIAPSTIAKPLSLNGNVTLGAGVTFDAGANKLTNVADPTANQDVATKTYVDNRTPLKFQFSGRSFSNVNPPGTGEVSLIAGGTTAGSLTISSSDFTNGGQIRIKLIGSLTEGDATTDQANIRVKLGGVVITTFSYISKGNQQTSPLMYDAILYLPTPAASSTVFGGQYLSIGDLAATGNTARARGSTGSGTVDLTVNQAIDVVYQRDAAGAGAEISVQIDHCSIEVLRR